MERWIKYKDMVINIRQHRVFTVRKFSKKSMEDGMVYCDPEVSKKVKAGKPWVLTLDHTSIDAFENKDAALNVAVDIVKGKYDIEKYREVRRHHGTTFRRTHCNPFI